MISRLTINPMGSQNNQPMTLGEAAGIVATVLAVGPEVHWAVRLALIAVGIGAVIFAGQRHRSHPLIRWSIALIFICILSYSPWADIWGGFHKEHPAWMWPHFVVRPLFHFILAAAVTIALLFRDPAWLRWRDYVFFFRSRVLNEQVWIDREAALKTIKTSKWAETRNPSSAFSVIFNLTSFTPEKDTILFNRFLELTLKNFEAKGTAFAREIDGKMQYDENALREFLDDALSHDSIKKYGDLPT